ncbi:hypothetical protein SBI_09430 [Streptomyces bingchenggensis BCW-1]|uniref:Uncharacterized protein n=1 Tax=Streptomyces bingchenggensis (strain BCW-1) TaxID=749414 RepID=D7C7K0_STRBB|nr:hypothetical protein SBI_09430 [Streptomyces bingchenggensis BCW-1]
MGGVALSAFAQRAVQGGGVGSRFGLGAGAGQGQQPSIGVSATGEVGDDVAAAPAGKRGGFTGLQVGQRIEGNAELAAEVLACSPTFPMP